MSDPTDETTTLPTAMIEQLYVLWELAWQLSSIHEGVGAERPEAELWLDLDLCLGELGKLQDDATAAATLSRDNDRLREENDAYRSVVTELRHMIRGAFAEAEQRADDALTDILRSWGINEATGGRPKH